jgi:6-phosphofructokinase 1
MGMEILMGGVTMKEIRKIGILTGGGDAPGLNAVIRAVVKTANIRYGVQTHGFLDGFKGLVTNKGRALTIADVSGILPRGGTILGTTNRDNPFNFLVIENGEEIYKDCSSSVMDNIKKLDIDALVVIGGDGSLHIARKFHRMGLPVVGVPKTIDNDLSATDVTFGFNTAMNTATDAIDKLHTTAESHHRVMVLEVMGRYAGWIAVEAGIAGGADVILIPEIPYMMDRVCNKIAERQNRGKYFSIVVVAEGAKPKGGEMVVQRYVKDTADPIRLGGVGHKIAAEIEALTGVETRVTILGHLQRGGSPSPFVRILATRYGVGAVELIMTGQFGRMVSLQTPNIVSVSLDEAVEKAKFVPADGDLVRAGKSVGISFGNE